MSLSFPQSQNAIGGGGGGVILFIYLSSLYKGIVSCKITFCIVFPSIQVVKYNLKKNSPNELDHVHTHACTHARTHARTHIYIYIYI